jgi:RNA polymerase sigma-70 factor, ECF subfamily
MSDSEQCDTDELVRRVAEGDEAAVSALLDRHRNRLKRMVAVRMDDAISARVDPSDVVQETLIEAVRKLPRYCRDPAIGFYPWLRQIAWEKVIEHHRRHLGAQQRSVRREEAPSLMLSDQSALQLANRFVSEQTSITGGVMRRELRSKVRATLSRLSESDREVLVLRYLEQLTADEAAAVLGVTKEAVKSRQRRAIVRFTRLVSEIDF